MSLRASAGQPQHLLRRHVLRRADHRPGLRQRRIGEIVGEPRESEVENLQHAGRRDHQVRRLDVPVHHAVVVCVGQSLAQVGHQADALRDIERPRRLDHLGQRLAVHQLHHEVRPAARIAAKVVNRDDVGVRERGGRASFPREPLEHLVLDRRFPRTGDRSSSATIRRSSGSQAR